MKLRSGRILSMLPLLVLVMSCGPSISQSAGDPAVQTLSKEAMPPDLSVAGKAEYTQWFEENAVSAETVAFINSHVEALGKVRYGVEKLLEGLEGAELMTRKDATLANSSHLKTPESVEEKIYREWVESKQAWEHHQRQTSRPTGAFPEGIRWSEARKMVFNAGPRDRFALRDVAGLRILVANPTQLKEVEARILARFEGAIVKEKDFYNDFYRGNGYRAIHIVVEELGKPVEIQIRTRLLHTWAQWQYRLVYKGVFKSDPDVFDYCVKVSDALVARESGATTGTRLPECPEVLKQEKDCFKEE